MPMAAKLGCMTYYIYRGPTNPPSPLLLSYSGRVELKDPMGQDCQGMKMQHN